MVAKFLKKYGWMYLPGVLFLALNSRIATWAPAALGDAIDLLKLKNPAAALVYQAALRIVLIALGVFVTRFIWRMFIIMNARRMEVFLREELFVKLQSLPPKFFARQRSGDMMAYAINDVGAVRQTFGPALAQGINGIITGSISIIEMIRTTDLRMTLLALAPVPLAMAAILILGGKIRTRSRRVQGLFAGLSGFVTETIMGVRVVKTFAREDEWQQSFDGRSDELRDANVALTDTSSLLNPVTLITFGVSYAVSLILGGSMVRAGTLALGELVAFQGYLLLIQHPVVALSRIVNMVQRGLASYKRLSAVYDEPSIPAFEESDHPPVGCAIEARHLTFTYPGMDAPALRDVSFTLPEGGILGIAGETGCGKTTLAALLMKFYDTPAGELFLGGEDITTVPARTIREMTGYVPQDGFLFSATVEDNINFYTPGCTHEDVLRAAEAANIRREIEAFPEGFETQVGERGTHLSGGQKQRISLARALVRDPKLLILDDTLSAVDNITEHTIISNLTGELSGRTAIIISHRLSALRAADLILYMDDGAVAEMGTHEELLALGGRYAETWAMQQKESEKEGGASDASLSRQADPLPALRRHGQRRRDRQPPGGCSGH